MKNGTFIKLLAMVLAMSFLLSLSLTAAERQVLGPVRRALRPGFDEHRGNGQADSGVQCPCFVPG